MANNNEKVKDPCGLTNYKDDEHRDDRYENGNLYKTTMIEMRSIEEKGISTEVQVSNSGESKVAEGNGKDIMEGNSATIQAFDGGYKVEKGRDE